ncbi:MAG TPA: AAA family ATPase [candidate division Zixibacteria bacterium]|nr:AAA family ATPase [candidate division Zixibacteria bacterium]
MPPKTKRTRKHTELTARQLDYSVNFRPQGVKSSDDVKPAVGVIGQDRAIEAIRTGLNMTSPGYNIFVTGSVGTGRTDATLNLLEQFTRAKEPKLPDICYVNNFKNEDCPRVLTFRAGQGSRFRKDMSYLIQSLRKVVPKVFMSEDYKDRQSRIIREYENRQKELIHAFEERLSNVGFVMVQIQSGLGTRNEIQPLIEDNPVSLEQLERQARDGKFPLSRLDQLRRTWDSLRREFDTITIEAKKLTGKMEDALEKLNHSMVAPLIADKVSLLKRRYPGAKVVEYLDEVAEALQSDLERFRESQARRGEDEAPPYRKREPFEEFSVNLILDNAGARRVPVVFEKSPSYKNLFGSLERVVDRFGYWRTDFTRIFGGSLLRAAGGYLVLDALDALVEPGVWTHLKRSLRNGEIEIAAYDPFYMMAGSGIKPEPIPIDVKVVLIGEPRVHQLLWHLDEDFKKIFKIKAEFDTEVTADRSNFKRYFEFLRKVVDEESLPPFDLSGMQAVVEYGMRLSGRRDKLSSRFSAISDIIREAAYCARQRGAAAANRDDVHCAITLKRRRVNLTEEKIQEMFDQNVLMVDTTGAAVGRINGLSVYHIGDYSFGRPSRITASTSLGRSGIINIEREADLSGPIHNKGVLVMSGYLRQLFAQDKPLAVSASITFEQAYSGVDGDSASSAEVYAILSSLGGLPIRQGIAVTGSVNQQGEIQPIGGVNQKVEGWFDVCAARGLTGDQGVIIPHQNVNDLLIRPDVIAAVKARRFHIWPIRTIAEAIEILTGLPAGKRGANGRFPKGTVFGIVDEKLMEMALTLQNFGRDDESSNRTDSAGKKRAGGAKESPRKRGRRRAAHPRRRT